MLGVLQLQGVSTPSMQAQLVAPCSASLFVLHGLASLHCWTTRLSTLARCSLICIAGVVDVCLIPEIQFDLQKLNEYVAKVIERKGHCVVCLAEGDQAQGPLCGVLDRGCRAGAQSRARTKWRRVKSVLPISSSARAAVFGGGTGRCTGTNIQMYMLFFGCTVQRHEGLCFTVKSTAGQVRKRKHTCERDGQPTSQPEY
eukprot:472238-Pelagomonas_calceolata.AAC.4